MDPKSLLRLPRQVRKRPFLFTLSFTITIVVAFFLFFSEGFFREKGRRLTSPEDSLRTTEAPKLSSPSSSFQEHPSVRFTYYRFQGSTLFDYLARGRTFSPRDGFALEPNWLKNEVFEEVQEVVRILKAAYHQNRPKALPYDVMSIYADGGNGKFFLKNLEDRDEEVPPSNDYRAIREQFYGALGPARSPSFVDFNYDDLMSRVASDPYWTIGSAEWKQGDATLVEFDKYSFFGMPEGAELLKSVKDPITRMILEARPELRDIAFFDVQAGAWGGYLGEILIREIKLVVLGVENVGDKPLGLNSVLQSEVKSDRLYAIRTDDEYMRELKAQKRVARPIPLEMLLPGEHLFIPLRLELGFATSLPEPDNLNYELCVQEGDLPVKWWRGYPSDRVRFQELLGVDEYYNATTRETPMNISVLEAKPDYRQLIADTYYFGSTIDVSQVVFAVRDGGLAPLDVRRFDPLNLVARGGYERGSCPILYMRTKDSWRRVRPVLKDAVTKSREQVDEVKVETLSSSFMLAEEEEETSYINLAALEITDRSGQRWVFYPLNSRPLQAKDDSYLVLRAGESVEVEFGVPDHLHSEPNRSLVFDGFYVPHFLIKGYERDPHLKK